MAIRQTHIWSKGPGPRLKWYGLGGKEDYNGLRHTSSQCLQAGSVYLVIDKGKEGWQRAPERLALASDIVKHWKLPLLFSRLLLL